MILKEHSNAPNILPCTAQEQRSRCFGWLKKNAIKHMIDLHIISLYLPLAWICDKWKVSLNCFYHILCTPKDDSTWLVERIPQKQHTTSRKDSNSHMALISSHTLSKDPILIIIFTKHAVRLTAQRSHYASDWFTISTNLGTPEF